jgi:hypothetical protein
VPLKVITSTLARLPNAYVYLIHPSFDLLEQTHEALLRDADSLGVQKYELLSRLCYFNDLRRQEECSGVFSQSDSGF